MFFGKMHYFVSFLFLSKEDFDIKYPTMVDITQVKKNRPLTD